MGLTEARASRADHRSESACTRILPYSETSDFDSVTSSQGPDPHACCGEELRPFWADDGRYISVCMRCGTEFTHKHMVRYNGRPWIGVDLDGTLASEIPDSEDPDYIGEPVTAMMQRVQDWIAQGQTVKIFTARASVPRQIALVKEWLKKHGLPDLEVTNAKDFKMIELWDDRAVQVARNSGQPLEKDNETGKRPSARVTIVARRKPKGSFVSKLRMFFAL